jgi:hypothetical protein
VSLHKRYAADNISFQPLLVQTLRLGTFPTGRLPAGGLPLAMGNCCKHCGLIEIIGNRYRDVPKLRHISGVMAMTAG